MLSCRWKCFRYMQIRLGLPWPGVFLRPDRGVGFLCTRQEFWANSPTAYRGIYRNCRENVRNMTVPVGSPQQKFRVDAVMPMEVLSLYADPIRPAYSESTS